MIKFMRKDPLSKPYEILINPDYIIDVRPWPENNIGVGCELFCRGGISHRIGETFESVSKKLTTHREGG